MLRDVRRGGWLILLIYLLSSCGALQGAQATATPLPMPTATILPTPVPATATVAPVLTATAVPLPTTLQVRVIQSDTNSPHPLIDVLTQTAALQQIPIAVDARSPDGTYTLASMGAAADHVDVWIGNEYDLQQLIKMGVVAATAPTLTVDHYAFYDRAVANNAKYMVMPIAARNYLVSIANSDLLASIPDTTANLMSINNQITGRVRYKMAFSWADGRWFQMLLDQLGASTVLTDAGSILPDEMGLTALQSLVDLRTLGPRDATTYLEATTDFVNWRVPFTIDGDAAIRRYERHPDQLAVKYAPAPVYSASGQRLLPPVDVVYAIIPLALPAARQVQVVQLMQALQEVPAQTELVRTMRWVPLNRGVANSGALPDDALFAVLAPQIDQMRPQFYDDVTICRWDAYESVLPLVLLRDITPKNGVEAINNGLRKCLIVP